MLLVRARQKMLAVVWSSVGCEVVRVRGSVQLPLAVVFCHATVTCASLFCLGEPVRNPPARVTPRLVAA